MDANRIKIVLLDYLINEDPDFIVSELPFYKGFRKADMVAFFHNTMTAFEIKSDRDKLSSLKEQINDYSQLFPFCYLVTTKKHIKQSRELLGRNIGIIIIENYQIIVIRKASEKKRLSKYSLALGISADNLPKYFGRNGEIQDYSNMEQIALKSNIESLKSAFYSAMHKKYFNKYKNFLADRGSITTLTDLYYLQTSF